MKITLSVLLLFLTSCAVVTPQSVSSPARLRDLGPAPEFTNETWLNTPEPLRLANLGGKVVLLEMWTFGCSNCRNTIPQLNIWHETYASQGLVIIGNHYPEFSNEANLQNLEQAVQDLGIEYPVAQDNDGATWMAYGNNYWSLYSRANGKILVTEIVRVDNEQYFLLECHQTYKIGSMFEIFRKQESVEIPIGFIEITHERADGIIQAKPIWILPIHLRDIERHELSTESLIVYPTFSSSTLPRWINDQAERKIQELLRKGAE